MGQNPQEKQAHSAVDAQVEHFLTTFAGMRQVMSADFKHAHQHGFSVTQYMVMGLLEKARGDEPCTISWIATHLGIDPATVVRTVDSLEKRGLVERRRDKQDRRQVFVEFTDVGRVSRQEMHQRFRTRIRGIFSAMSEEGRVALLAGLEEFVRVGQLVGTPSGTPEDVPSSKGELHGC